MAWHSSAEARFLDSMVAELMEMPDWQLIGDDDPGRLMVQGRRMLSRARVLAGQAQVFELPKVAAAQMSQLTSIGGAVDFQEKLEAIAEAGRQLATAEAAEAAARASMKEDVVACVNLMREEFKEFPVESPLQVPAGHDLVHIVVIGATVHVKLADPDEPMDTVEYEIPEKFFGAGAVDAMRAEVPEMRNREEVRLAHQAAARRALYSKLRAEFEGDAAPVGPASA